MSFQTGEEQQNIRLADCFNGRNEWECPDKNCRKKLSRKQTLITHIQCFHTAIAEKLDADTIPKKYKLYEVDPTVPIPRSTLSARKRKISEFCEASTSNVHDNDGAGPNHAQELAEAEEYTERCGDSGDEESIYASASDMSISSSDDEELADREVQCESQKIYDKSDPPLYLVPPRNEPYYSPITKSEHALGLGALATRHNLSNSAISDILELVQLHMPSKNIGLTSIKALKEECGFSQDYLQYQLYCDVCKKVFNNTIDVCPTPGCPGVNRPDSTKYFVKSDIKLQFREILERPETWQTIKESYSLEYSDVLSDIKSGKAYMKLKEPGGFLHDSQNITLTMFTDGVALFKSSSVTLWPIYLLINELPPKDRFHKRNMILWGIWQGVGKPKMLMFFKPFVMDMLDLYTEGFTFKSNRNEIVKTKAILLIATMDLQARAYVLNMTQHNGENGCLYCMEPGESTPTGAGYCRAYPYRDTSPELRTDCQTRESAASARLTGKRVDGFYGECALTYLPYFQLTENVVIDYMHGILLGVSKKLLELWFDRKHVNNVWYIGDKIKVVDKVLTKIYPPYFIHRRPRPINNNYHHWKASELRNWLLFYAIPCMKDVMEGPFLVHFSCLVEGTFILLQEGITPTDLQRANTLLQTFVKNVQTLYGTRFMSMNVHNVLHLPAMVEKWGPLWAWSCFPFESYNGEIVSSIHGKGNVCKDVFWHLQAQKRVHLKSRDISEVSRTGQFVKKMFDSTLHKRCENARQCTVIKQESVKNLTELEKQFLENEHGSCDKTQYMMCSKISRNGFLMYSQKCSRVKKQNSYTILLAETDQYASSTAIEVSHYIVHLPSKTVFAVGQLLIPAGTILENRLPHLKRYERGSNTMVKIELLQEPLIVMKANDQLYCTGLPNHHETD